VPHRSYVKGWKIGPSHYVNQDLATIWLDQERRWVHWPCAPRFRAGAYDLSRIGLDRLPLII
jgi:hypothetical protein